MSCQASVMYGNSDCMPGTVTCTSQSIGLEGSWFMRSSAHVFVNVSCGEAWASEGNYLIRAMSMGLYLD